MKRTQLLGRVSCCCLLTLVVVGCDEPPMPTHHVGTAELPVVEVQEASGVDSDKFQLIQLKDGHDYWFYRNQGSEKGYAALAHSPECKKCSARGSIKLDEPELGNAE